MKTKNYTTHDMKINIATQTGKFPKCKQNKITARVVPNTQTTANPFNARVVPNKQTTKCKQKQK